MWAIVKDLSNVCDPHGFHITDNMKELVGKTIEFRKEVGLGDYILYRDITHGGWNWDESWLEFVEEPKKETKMNAKLYVWINSENADVEDLASYLNDNEQNAYADTDLQTLLEKVEDNETPEDGTVFELEIKGNGAVETSYKYTPNKDSDC